jgi:hypothetical protein
MVNIAGVITLQCRSFGDVVLPAFTPQDELGTCTWRQNSARVTPELNQVCGVRTRRCHVLPTSIRQMSDKLQFVVDSNKGHSKPTIDLDSSVTDKLTHIGH